MLTRLNLACALIACVLTVTVRAYDLTESCQLPVSKGGGGDCSSVCSTVTKSTTGTCTFTSTTQDYAANVAKFTKTTCTQSTDSRCTTAFLTATFGKFAAVKAAYCNANYLVIHTSNAPHWTPYLDDAKTPPGATDTVIGACRTRTASITQAFATYKIPLTVTKLSTAAGTNNIGAFDYAGDTGTSGVGYLVNTSDTSTQTLNGVTVNGTIYGFNARGGAGVTVGGQEIFPVYNNRGQYTPQDCEVDACNEHVGGGGGQPHLHGDPFHSTDGVCLYGPANYTSTTAHPPLWGFSLDGYNIYGRYLSTTSEGYTIALDDCGGHDHGTYGYHYHSQVITAYTSTGAASGVTKNTAYAVFPPGPFKCWRGDITSVPGGKTTFWTSDKSSSYFKPCTGATNYYVASGITISGAGTQSKADSADKDGVTAALPAGPAGTAAKAATAGASTVHASLVLVALLSYALTAAQ